MIHPLLYTLAFLASITLIIAVFGRSKNKTNKILLLIIGDILFIVSEFLYPFPKDIGLTIPPILIGILSLLAIRKITSPPNPNQELMNTWHDDPKNWKAGVFYYNPEDKRIFPPKRIEGIGWTVNFANPYSVAIMVGIIALIMTFLMLIAIYTTK